MKSSVFSTVILGLISSFANFATASLNGVNHRSLRAPNPDIMAGMKPTDEERSRNPDQLWFFDNPYLVQDPTYLLTNDYGQSAPYLVEAGNETHWAALEAHVTPTGASSAERRDISYINSYGRPDCVDRWYTGQWGNPGNGQCHGWSNGAPSVFVVGSGNHQVNMYYNYAHNCDSGFIGGLKGWSGCYNAPWAEDGQLIGASWVCYNC